MKRNNSRDCHPRQSVRKILSLVLSLCLMISITAGIDFSANAQYYTIEQVAQMSGFQPGTQRSDLNCKTFCNAVWSKMYGLTLGSQKSNQIELNTGSGNYQIGSTLSYSSGNLNSNNVQNLLRQSISGDVIQLYSNSTGFLHAAMIYSNNGTGITIYDCIRINGVYTVRTKSYSTYAAFDSGWFKHSSGEGISLYRSPNNTGSSSGGSTSINVPNAPTNVRTVSGKSLFTAQEYIEFAWDSVANANDYWIYMWKDGVQIYATDMGNSTSFTSAPISAGNYTLIVRAGNSAGYSTGKAQVQFGVYDKIPNAPSYVVTENNYKSFQSSSYIRLDWEKVNTATSYWVYMWKDGKEIYNTNVGNTTSFTSAPTSKGNYTFIVRAGNDYGWCDGGASVSFRVYDIYTIYFNANGGSCSTTSKTVYTDAWYGDLPTPTRTNYTFDGWYTSATGGIKITSDMRSDISSNQTLYAHWKQNHTHSYTVSSTTSATCTSNGYITKKCACGATQTTTLKATGHKSVSSNNAVAATCTTDGKESDTKCSTCGVKLTTGKTITAKGHSYTKTKVVAPTYAAKGYTLYTCSKCKATKKSDYKNALTVAKPTVTKVASPKSKQIIVTWGKKSYTGYQVQIATDSKFTKNKKSATIKSAKTVSKTFTGLKGKTKYYVRVRAYKTYNGKNYYSSWSTVKTITTKK